MHTDRIVENMLITQDIDKHVIIHAFIVIFICCFILLMKKNFTVFYLVCCRMIVFNQTVKGWRGSHCFLFDIISL